MREKWLRKHLEKNDWNDFFYEETKQRVARLCERLGIEFTEDPEQQTEMWAQIGDYLALNECPEFSPPPLGRGRPKKIDDSDVRIAELVEKEQDKARKAGKTISDAATIQQLINDDILDERELGGLRSRLVEGRKKLESIRFYGGTDNEYTAFDLLRADRDRSCGKIRD